MTPTKDALGVVPETKYQMAMDEMRELTKRAEMAERIAADRKAKCESLKETNADLRKIIKGLKECEASLGRGTCRQEERGWSTEGDHARVWLTCGHDCMVETVADLPSFCPVCGAEVMDE